MRKKFSDVLWGLFWIGLGIVVMLSAFDVWDFSIGYLISRWWPLLIIIPSMISIVRHGFGFGFITLVIGVMLLLNNWDIIDGSTFRKLIIPVILILIGLNLVFRNVINSGRRNRMVNIDPNSPNFTATFSTQSYSVNGQPFFGAKVEAVFGTVILDLRNAIINNDVVIQADAIFGHVTVLVPPELNVKATSSSIFGSVNNKSKRNEAMGPTVYVDGTNVFGGVTIE